VILNRFLREDKIIWNKDLGHKPIIFWGCGNNAIIIRQIMKQKGIIPSAYVDNDLEKAGNEIDGVKVYSYEDMKRNFKDYIIFLTVAVNNAVSIKRQLLEAGELHPVFHLEKPFKVDEEFLEYDYVREHEKEFEAAYSYLADELSRTLFIENVNFRLCGNKMKLLQYIDGNTFFDKRLIAKKDDHIYVDAGAYTGDTLLRFYAFCGGNYKHLYAMEPDPDNFRLLTNVVKGGRICDTTLFPVGGWDKKDVLTFYTVSQEANKNFDSPNFFKNMQNTMPDAWKIHEENFVEEKIPVDTVDNLLNGGPCTVLKINALAADLQILRGSEQTIKKYRPVIVGEFGARKENLTEMFRLMKLWNPSYSIFLRQKEIFGDSKTVFIVKE